MLMSWSNPIPAMPWQPYRRAWRLPIKPDQTTGNGNYDYSVIEMLQEIRLRIWLCAIPRWVFVILRLGCSIPAQYRPDAVLRLLRSYSGAGKGE